MVPMLLVAAIRVVGALDVEGALDAGLVTVARRTPLMLAAQQTLRIRVPRSAGPAVRVLLAAKPQSAGPVVRVLLAVKPQPAGPVVRVPRMTELVAPVLPMKEPAAPVLAQALRRLILVNISAKTWRTAVTLLSVQLQRLVRPHRNVERPVGVARHLVVMGAVGPNVGVTPPGAMVPPRVVRQDLCVELLVQAARRRLVARLRAVGPNVGRLMAPKVQQPWKLKMSPSLLPMRLPLTQKLGARS